MILLCPRQSDMDKLAARVALRHVTAKGSLEDVSKLRFQAVFLMGAGGSGKGFVGRKWMKYMPGGGSKGIDFNKQPELANRRLTEMERGQSNITFEKAQKALKDKYNIRVTPVPGGAAIPFVLHTYDGDGHEMVLSEKDWKKELPAGVYDQVMGLKEVVFGAPKHEIPSFWRQVDPDLYKKELAGYSDKQPGYVHEMSSAMAKAYYEAILETGDPLFVDGTGTNVKKMANFLKEAKAAGYKTSLIFVAVPLTVNQIRNATRSRNVNPNIVTFQWKRIPEVYDAIKGIADKAKVIVNRLDKMDRGSFRAHADEVDGFIAKNTSFDSLYELIKKEAPNELREWGKVLKRDARESERERRFKRLEEKRKERGLPGREFVAKPISLHTEFPLSALTLENSMTTTAAERVRDAYMKTAAVVTVRDKCRVTLLIDKVVPQGKPNEFPTQTHHFFWLVGRIEHDPSFGIPIKFKAQVMVAKHTSGEEELVSVHTEGRAGKVQPKAFSAYVKTLLQQYYGSWVGSLPF